jgi:uncharacterized SAM-binding protein YcdF (DUF218 family)
VWLSIKLGLKIAGVVFAAVVAYLAVTFVQVSMAAQRDQARPAQAIIVMGSAQYNGVPSPDLKARLDHALDLWQQKLAPILVVTGGRQTGDAYTEATAEANYLLGHGVPDSSILREVNGQDTWDSLAAAAAFLRQRGITRVLLVSDPFHDARMTAMASELGLHGFASPTRTSPIRGMNNLDHLLKETVEVALGRIIGFRRLMGVGHRVG